MASEPKEEVKGGADYVRLQSTRECGCPKLLIVDDSDCNLFVLQNYLRCVGLIADEVIILIILHIRLKMDKMH